MNLLKIIFRSNSTNRNYKQKGRYTIIYYNLITNGYNSVTFVDVYWEMLYNFIVNLSERAVALKNFIKNIPAVTKIVLSCIAAELIIFLIYSGCKWLFRYVAYLNNDDPVVCELSTSDFAFGFVGTKRDDRDDKELQLYIVYAQFPVFGGDPFYESQETRPITRKPLEKISAAVLEECGITFDNVVTDEKGLVATNIYNLFMDEEGKEKYGLSERYVDFKTCGEYYCGPYLIELKDGREYIIYKSFDRLYLHTV